MKGHNKYYSIMGRIEEETGNNSVGKLYDFTASPFKNKSDAKKWLKKYEKELAKRDLKMASFFETEINEEWSPKQDKLDFTKVEVDEDEL